MTECKEALPKWASFMANLAVLFRTVFRTITPTRTLTLIGTLIRLTLTPHPSTLTHHSQFTLIYTVTLIPNLAITLNLILTFTSHSPSPSHLH